MNKQTRFGPRSREVLNYIEAVVQRDGIAPTYSMIGEHLAIERHDVCKFVCRLEQLGLIERRPVNSRMTQGWHLPVIILKTPTTGRDFML